MPGYTVTGIYYSEWQSTDALHCRVIGLADREMLYIKHSPIVGEYTYRPEFEIIADIIPLSGEKLNSDSVFLIYKTNTRTYDTVNFVSISENSYKAVIKVKPM